MSAPEPLGAEQSSGTDQPMDAEQDRPSRMVQMRSSTTGAWPGEDPRQAASAAFDDLAAGWPAVPLTAIPARGGTRWAVDAIGAAVRLLDELPVDHGSYGWRLSGGAGRDVRVEHSRFARTLDALGEYGEGYAGRTLLSLPGPWTVVHALSLPDGRPVLADQGAVRDVVQVYAGGLAAELDRVARLLGTRPRMRLWEPVLDVILTGSVPTVSGFRTLPALPEQAVLPALASVLRRTGDDTIVSLPRLDRVRIAGKDVAHRQQLADAGVRALSVPLETLTGPAGTGPSAAGWEEVAQAVEAGTEVWIRLPGHAGSRPDEVNRWVGALADPWTGIGMSPDSLAGFGVLTGWELPTGLPPLLPAEARAAVATGNCTLAARIIQALEELA